MSHESATPFCNDNPDGHLCLLAAGHTVPHECFVDGCGLSWPTSSLVAEIDRTVRSMEPFASEDATRQTGDGQ